MGGDQKGKVILKHHKANIGGLGKYSLFWDASADGKNRNDHSLKFGGKRKRGVKLIELSKKKRRESRTCRWYCTRNARKLLLGFKTAMRNTREKLLAISAKVTKRRYKKEESSCKTVRLRHGYEGRG